jgi:hypothetical protein
VATPLYRQHSAALAATYQDIENHALAQGEALVGTPGAISLRRNAAGAGFYVRQYYDHDRAKRDQYLASEGAADAQRLVADWKRRIDDAKGILASVRLLSREGYSILGPKHLAAIAPLSNHGVFEAGAVLVGTHAFEVIVNRLGIRVASFATEDVDVARPGKLALAKPAQGGLLELLRESGIDFVDVPALNRRDPPTSYKERGRSRFTFDLLVPAAGNEIAIQPVPELKAHATALPYLRYLLGETQVGAALSNHGVASVRIPIAERFALHKLVVAQVRQGRPEKSAKDLRQAAALIAALGELQPGALEEAYGRTPVSSRRHIRKSLGMIRGSLDPHPQAWEALSAFAGA